MCWCCYGWDKAVLSFVTEGVAVDAHRELGGRIKGRQLVFDRGAMPITQWLDFCQRLIDDARNFL